MKTTQRVSLCGVMSALATTTLLLTVFPYATYALAAFAGMLFVPVALECGTRYGILSYIATAFLAIFLTPDPEAKCLFVLFFGYYPLVHLRLQLCRCRWLIWIVKIVLFNITALADFYLLTYVLGVPKEEYMIAGVYVPWVLLIVGNIVFLIYDTVLVRVEVFYRVRVHPKLKTLWK